MSLFAFLKKQFESDYCKTHPTVELNGIGICQSCFNDVGREYDRKERRRKVRLIADGVKLALSEIEKEKTS